MFFLYFEVCLLGFGDCFLQTIPIGICCLFISVGVKQEDHDVLLAEVQRLEVELGKIRQDLQGVMGCKGKCEQLDTLQETVHSTNINSCVNVH